MFSYAIGSVAVLYPVQEGVEKGPHNKGSAMDPEQEHHMCGMLMGCCSPYSSVLNVPPPYILGGARIEGNRPTTEVQRSVRRRAKSGWLLDTAQHQS